MRLLLALAVGVATALVAAPAHAGTAYKVSLSVSATTLDYGKTLTLSGSVSPKAAGAKVTIQRRVGSGSWKSITTRTLSSTSRYSYAVKPGPGVVGYRVIKSRSGSHATGISSTRTVSVYRWRYLADLPTASATSMTTGTFTLNNSFDTATTRSYAKSVRLLSGGFGQWSLVGLHCRLFQSSTGVDATNPSTSAVFTAQYAIYYPVTGNGYYDKGVAADQFPRDAYIRMASDVEAINLSTYRSDSVPDVVDAVVFGSARVNCAS
ncbi:hypothetical protein ASE12_03035 [Aeromicrobium sp. Root236]|uniref:hypothetical protein n=1 Tax=Aeromicrobium sp. Root236 TaxID=1736498 RepID=UPI0006F64A26|nr:hypothetical protein [Aeromicrobium sp. Root236]KRC63828.1 hypothetical protein ASE12_03035 [Aeromicrobium sp. Root236]